MSTIPPTDPASPAPGSPPPAYDQPPPKSSPKLIPMLLAAVVVAALVAVLALSLTGDDDTSTPDSTEAPAVTNEAPVAPTTPPETAPATTAAP